MRIVTIVLAILFCGVVALPTFADESGISINITGGSEASQSCVSVKSCYEPDIVTIQPKTLVIWTNIDSTTHTVTSGEPSENDTGTMFDSDQIAPSGTYSFMFMDPGTYNYFCSIHPWMTGQVTVSTNIAGLSSNSITTPEFGPEVILVFMTSVLLTLFLVKNRLSFRF